MYEALTTKNEFGRTPLHNAAALYGSDSDVFQGLEGLEQFALRIVEDAMQVRLLTHTVTEAKFPLSFC